MRISRRSVRGHERVSSWRAKHAAAALLAICETGDGPAESRRHRPAGIEAMSRVPAVVREQKRDRLV
jgi:hypothetical protein